MTDKWHGTPHGYYRKKCRCPKCRNAHRVRTNEIRARRFAERVVEFGVLVHPGADIVHGRYTTYANYGCHCSPCRLAHNEYHREYERRRA